MSENKSNRFIKYFPLLLDALRSVDPAAMRPAEAMAWIRSRVNIKNEDLTRLIVNGKQSIFENDVHWARFYLAKAGLISTAKRGLWSLTPEGRDAQLTPDETWKLYVRIRDANRPNAQKFEKDGPAPETADEDDGNAISYWYVGAMWNHATEDQTERFLAEGTWENETEDKFSVLVRRMKSGDRIAIKATFVRRYGLPFDVGEKPVSVMRIKATGVILENLNNGLGVRVAWDPPSQPREWYFYTYRKTIVEAAIEYETALRLIDFTFRGGTQDYAWWLAQPYWAEKYAGATKQAAANLLPDSPDALDEFAEFEDEPTYTVESIIAEGCFFSHQELSDIIGRWGTKKNLVLQGPPGTGKTWLAKRLGFALVGSNDRETSRCRLRVVQFHPSLAYEDFVRGWRPAGDGKLALVDGILMQAIEAAASEPDRPFVLVIEEINRGNPAQIFGEMLTLLENTKRRPSEALELAYKKNSGERVYVPDNLFVVGTMNVADRSLAIVDLALRRRFAFVDLEPRFGPAWREWCVQRGMSEAMLGEIERRITALNADIAGSASLGPQFRIGHSYVTPDLDEPIGDSESWFRARVETEIAPLLDEYWYDVPDKARSAKDALLAKFAS